MVLPATTSAKEALAGGAACVDPEASGEAAAVAAGRWSGLETVSLKFRYDRDFIPNAKCKKFATNLKFLHDGYP